MQTYRLDRPSMRPVGCARKRCGPGAVSQVRDPNFTFFISLKVVYAPRRTRATVSLLSFCWPKEAWRERIDPVTSYMIPVRLEGLVGRSSLGCRRNIRKPGKWPLRRAGSGWPFGYVRAWEVAVDLGSGAWEVAGNSG